MTRGNVLAAPVAKDYRNVNDEDLTAARATLLWHPIDQLDVSTMIFFRRPRRGG